MNKINLNTLL